MKKLVTEFIRQVIGEENLIVTKEPKGLYRVVCDGIKVEVGSDYNSREGNHTVLFLDGIRVGIDFSPTDTLFNKLTEIWEVSEDNPKNILKSKLQKLVGE